MIYRRAVFALCFLIASILFCWFAYNAWHYPPFPFGRSAHADTGVLPGDGRIRAAFVDINTRFAEICEQIKANCQVVNVGSHENAGDGDTLTVALAKIRENLRLIERYLALTTTEGEPAKEKSAESGIAANSAGVISPSFAGHASQPVYSGPSDETVRAYKKICANDHELRRLLDAKTANDAHAPISPYCDAYDHYVENWWPRYLMRIATESP